MAMGSSQHGHSPPVRVDGQRCWALDVPRRTRLPGVSRQLGMALPHRGPPCLNSGTASSPAEQLSGLISGYMPAQLVHVMARLGLADVLVDQQMSVEELCVSVGAETDMMRRLLRGLAGSGWLRWRPTIGSR
jgi:hypothetical protein